MKILLVDKHPVTRLGLRGLVGGIEGSEVVGEAAGFDEALRLSERLRPDLVILDPGLIGDGVACGDLKSAGGATKVPAEESPRVLVYSALNSREYVAAASLAGADGFVHKEVEADRLLEAIRRTGEGERVWMLGPVESRVETALRARVEAARLTPREKQILNLLLRRRSNPEIAEFLHVSVNTVRTHVKHVLKELGLSSRRELLDGQRAA